MIPAARTSAAPASRPSRRWCPAMTRMRAVELGVWVVQSAPSGISALVDPEGRVVKRTGLFEAAVIRASIGLERSETPFARFGELPVIALAVVAMVWAIGPWTADILRIVVDSQAPPEPET